MNATKHVAHNTEFHNWWWNIGSGIKPLANEDTEEFAKRIALISWQALESRSGLLKKSIEHVEK